MGRQFLFENNAASRLLVPVSAVDTTLTLPTDHGDRFPDPLPYEWEYDYVNFLFAVTLTDPATGVQEICHCYAREGDTLFVSRAQEGTSAKVWPENTVVALQLTAATLNWLRDL